MWYHIDGQGLSPSNEWYSTDTEATSNAPVGDAQMIVGKTLIDAALAFFYELRP